MKRLMKPLALALSTTTLCGVAQAEELRMSWWGGDSRHEATQAALQICGERHGHTISPEFTGFSGHFERLATQIAGGTEPDIMQVNWPWLPIFSADGSRFADLNELSHIIDLSNWSAEQLASGTMNGHLNGLPVSTTARLFAFNTTAWERAGLPLPTTWDELVAAGPVFRERLGEGNFPFEAAALDATLIVLLYGTQSTGRSLIDASTNEIAWSAEELTAAIEFYRTLVDNNVVPSWEAVAAAGNVPLEENPNWTEGRIGGTYQWDTTYFKISDPMAEGEELVYTAMLSQPGQQTQGIYRKPSMVFAISANTEHPEAAAQILNCLMNEEAGVMALGSTRGIPASTAAREMLMAAGGIGEVQIDAQNRVLEGEGPTIHPFMEHPDVRTAMIDALEMFAYGRIDAATAADEMLIGIEAVLADM
ncbi:ABC transporter substrate-binding protein [Roseicyclus sp.]|uniref:ABC transporter substrate-binding protein n=1 Tax=Roseicyclus sp. TaxID=1914329 RepID=UPI003F9EEC6D